MSATSSEEKIAVTRAFVDRVFNADPAACPAASRVGMAKAITPILPVPLVGPAYFVSHGGAQFPELAIVLQGYGITVQLHAETFMHHRRQNQGVGRERSVFLAAQSGTAGVSWLKGVCGRGLWLPQPYSGRAPWTRKISRRSVYTGQRRACGNASV